MKNRIFAVILVLATVFSAVSCTAGGNSNSNGITSSDSSSSEGSVSSSEADSVPVSSADATTPESSTPESSTPESSTPESTTPESTTPEQTTTEKPTTSTTKTPTTTAPIIPDPVDDGVRVHSWLSDSYTKVLGTYVANDDGNVYNFKDWYGVQDSPFRIMNRNHKTGKMTEYTTFVDKTCTYRHESTVCDTVIRVNKPGKGNVFNCYSNPGLFYMLTKKDHDLLLTFVAPEDGTYRVRASAKRTFKCYSLNGVIATGSRFFIESDGVVYAEDTDHAADSTRRIALEATITLKKGDTVFFGHDPISSDNIQSHNISASADDSVIDYFIVERMGEGTPSSERESNKHSVNMAKNESESFQLSVNSFEDVKGVSIHQVSPKVNNISVEFLEEYLVMTNDEPYPDGMVLSSGVFNLKAKETKTMLIRFKTNKNTKAGTYTYKFELRSPSGWVLETYTVTVNVWSFALPDDPSSDALTSVNKSYIVKHEGINNNQLEFYYKSYYDLLLDYKMNAYYLPYDVLDDRADAYMSDPRVGSFQIWADASDEKLLEYYKKLKTNPVWLEKAYFYPFDEPTSVEHLNELATKCERLKRLCPDIRIVIPFFRNVKYSGTQDEIDFLDKYLGIWCPKSACWNSSFLQNPLGRPYFGDRMNAQKASGDKLWWYVCWEPGNPYCNLYVNELGVEHRELFWQQYLYGVDGLLYWQSNTWGSVNNPWDSMVTVPSLSNHVYGDGSLMYPGRYVGYGGPCASLRLEAVRDGIEDFDMLLLAEKYLGKSWVTAEINKVTTSVIEHASDDELFDRIRTEIGNKLSEKLS